ncbi:hypothetical protein FXF68_33935 [Actinomadura decatromicini]|uniref:Chitin-binding type-3 domain-containing protein n=1 Tax=Actinomadura decatromicini TaxID=2604572 RepID=A0A5D3F8E1_9ACTN|nr:hypothetical protein FXF68_33935 [Actinomadura decatromicini]
MSFHGRELGGRVHRSAPERGRGDRGDGRAPRTFRFGYAVLGGVVTIVLFVGVFSALQPHSDPDPAPGVAASEGPVPESAPPTESTWVPPGTAAPGRSGAPTPSRTPSATPSAVPTGGTRPPRTPPPGRRVSTPAWAVGVAYRPGDAVTYHGVRYVCRQAHRSQADWQPQLTPGLWQAT